MPLSPLLLSLTLFCHFAAQRRNLLLSLQAFPRQHLRRQTGQNFTIHPPAARVVLKITDSYFSS
jgi:hypothetical protein